MSFVHEILHRLKQSREFSSVKTVHSHFDGTSPSVFVGHGGYPTVRVGILSSTEPDSLAKMYDAPTEWSERSLTSDQILSLRSALVCSRYQTPIRASHRFMELSQELSMAKNAVDVEIDLDKKPKQQLLTSSILSPLASFGRLKSATLTSNPRIPLVVQKVHSDTDLGAAEAMEIMADKGVDEHQISMILSMGNVGMGPRRKLVPTRWSITATDDTLSKQLIDELRDYQECGFEMLFGGYLGNYYLVMLFPGVWSYELYEIHAPSVQNVILPEHYTADFESQFPKRGYSPCVGGYYATRLALAEKLVKTKRRGQALVLRFITSEYETPLGVWVVREATRKSMAAQPREFDCQERILAYASQFVRNKFGLEISDIVRRSKLLEGRKQRTLKEY